tara:strand:- start:214 stop:585 length:372 start_codon:yes stop_codon:yes gene_type:complete
MTLAKQFTLEAAEKPKTNNSTHQRRQKFIAAVDKQFAALPGGNSTVLSRSSNWVWQSEKGDWFISPRYGKAPLELAPGLNSIKCSSTDDAVKTLQKLKTLASEGKLDTVLEAAASEIRSRFGK